MPVRTRVYDCFHVKLASVFFDVVFLFVHDGRVMPMHHAKCLHFPVLLDARQR
jgi:hypothetical protein